MGVPCINCKEPFEVETGGWWEGILLCSRCHKVAARIQKQGKARLKYLLATLDQAIKQAVLDGRLQFATQEEANEEMDEPTFLSMLQELARKSRVVDERRRQKELPRG